MCGRWHNNSIELKPSVLNAFGDSIGFAELYFISINLSCAQRIESAKR